MIDSEINDDDDDDNNDSKKNETSYQLVHRNVMTVDAGDHQNQHQNQHQHSVHSSSSSPSPPPFSFKLPPDLAAKEPPERRGIARDEVRLLVINRKSYETDRKSTR